MKTGFRLILLALGVFVLQNTVAQGFVRSTDVYGINHFASGTYGTGVTFFDWNNDGWDDMVFLMTDSLPAFYENNHNGFTRVVFPGIDIQDEVKSVIFTDFDNDNLYDLSFTSFMGGCRLYHNTGDFVFEEITASAGIPDGAGEMTFCQAWGDYDLDGDLDFFICNYNSDSGNPGYDALYRNNGNLTFTNVTDAAGIFSDLDPTFCAVWSDYNNDGLPDLFVLNDRASWRNFLYRNNGNGTFTEVGVSAGMSDFMDSMSATVGDYNNDGREDIYISNTPFEGNKLFRNNANSLFSNSAASLGVQIFGWSWGASWIDYNNDGKQDLFVATQTFVPMAQPGGLYLLKNNSGSFDLVYNSGLQTVSGATFSVARGDLNNDGFYDLITNSYAPMNAQVWTNLAVGGHYIRMRLEGTASNSLAAGTKITVSAGGQKYFKQIYVGEQYLSQNSQWQNFGIGTEAQVDTVTIKWPSGFVETYLNLDADANYTFVEGATLHHSIINQSGTTEFCEGDSIMLSGQPGYLQYNWSDGQNGQTVYIRHSDTISLQVFDGMFYVKSDTLFINELQSPVDSIRVLNPSCFGSSDGEIELLMNNEVNPVEIHWLQGQTSGILSDATAGLYQVEVQWSGTCHKAYEINLPQPEELTPGEIWLSAPGFSESCAAGFTANLPIAGGTQPYNYFWEVFEQGSGQSVFSAEGDTLYCIPANLPHQVECTVADANGCIANAVFDTPEILGVFESESYLSVYPQPFHQSFVIQGRKTGSEVELRLFDSGGRLCYHVSKLNISAPREVHPGPLAPGIYLLLISDGFTSKTTKLIHE